LGNSGVEFGKLGWFEGSSLANSACFGGVVWQTRVWSLGNSACFGGVVWQTRVWSLPNSSQVIFGVATVTLVVRGMLVSPEMRVWQTLTRKGSSLGNSGCEFGKLSRFEGRVWVTRVSSLAKSTCFEGVVWQTRVWSLPKSMLTFPDAPLWGRFASWSWKLISGVLKPYLQRLSLKVTVPSAKPKLDDS